MLTESFCMIQSLYDSQSKNFFQRLRVGSCNSVNGCHDGYFDCRSGAAVPNWCVTWCQSLQCKPIYGPIIPSSSIYTITVRQISFLQAALVSVDCRSCITFALPIRQAMPDHQPRGQLYGLMHRLHQSLCQHHSHLLRISTFVMVRAVQLNTASLATWLCHS